jgi:hypothetical protein
MPSRSAPMRAAPHSLWREPKSIAPVSPLLTLAEDAGRAGQPMAAEHLVYLAHIVLDRPAELGV